MTAMPGHKHAPVDRIAWTKTAILFGMGAYFSLLLLTGNVSNYINQRFAWLVVVGAVVFVSC